MNERKGKDRKRKSDQEVADQNILVSRLKILTRPIAFFTSS